MVRMVVFIFVSILMFGPCQAQYLTFDQLLVIQQKDVIEAEEYLTAKGWIFYDAKKGGDGLMNVATFAYNKSSYSNEALLWLKFMYSNTSINKRISYQLHDQTEYNNLVNRIKSSGYKLIKSDIADGHITKTYSNDKKTVEVESSKNEDYFNSSTIYNVFLLDTHDYITEFSSVVGKWRVTDMNMEGLSEEETLLIKQKIIDEDIIFEFTNEGVFRSFSKSILTAEGKYEHESGSRTILMWGKGDEKVEIINIITLISDKLTISMSANDKTIIMEMKK